MFVENANRAAKEGVITPDNLEPNPKKPLIAAFFRTIGWSDQLGSGVRNLYRYTRVYSGKDPVFQEGDVFRIIVPLDDTYSFDRGIGSADPKKNIATETKDGTICGTIGTIGTDAEKILALMAQKPEITQKALQSETGISLRTVKRIVADLQKEGKVVRIGNNRSGKWQVQ